MLLKQQDKFKESTTIALDIKSLSPAWLLCSAVFGSSVGRTTPIGMMDPEVFNHGSVSFVVSQFSLTVSWICQSLDFSKPTSAYHTTKKIHETLQSKKLYGVQEFSSRFFLTIITMASPSWQTPFSEERVFHRRYI
jgi:hypothetical protein